MSGRHRDFPLTPWSHICITSPRVSIPHQMVHLLQLMVLHWHVTITQSPQLTFGGTHSKGLSKHITINVHHYSITQSSFTALKLFCAPPIQPWVLIRLFFFFSFLFGHAVHKACRILVPLPGIEPGPLKWKHRVVIVGPLGNCQIRQNFFFVARRKCILIVHPWRLQ